MSGQRASLPNSPYAKQEKAETGCAEIAEHAGEEMTKDYQRGYSDAVWPGAVPDLDIRQLAE